MTNVEAAGLEDAIDLTEHLPFVSCVANRFDSKDSIESVVFKWDVSVTALQYIHMLLSTHTHTHTHTHTLKVNIFPLLATSTPTSQATLQQGRPQISIKVKRLPNMYDKRLDSNQALQLDLTQYAQESHIVYIHIQREQHNVVTG